MDGPARAVFHEHQWWAAIGKAKVGGPWDKDYDAKMRADVVNDAIRPLLDAAARVDFEARALAAEEALRRITLGSVLTVRGCLVAEQAIGAALDVLQRIP